MELNLKVNNSLEILKNSALFSMSLGAKELFHSNFIAYLLSSKNKNLNSAKNALKQVFFGKIFDGEIVCLREKNNLDLILIRSNFKDLNQDEISCVVVEIKLKSTPTKKQLDNYDEKIKGGIKLEKLLSNECDTNNQIIKIEGDLFNWRLKRPRGEPISTKIRKVLLAPTKPLSTSEGENQFWNYISWIEVINSLKKNIITNNDLENMILENYVVSLENILVILNEINII